MFNNFCPSVYIPGNAIIIDGRSDCRSSGIRRILSDSNAYRLCLACIYPLDALIDCVQRDFKDKLLWVIVILVGGPIGALAYYFAVRKKMANDRKSATRRKKSRR